LKQELICEKLSNIEKMAINHVYLIDHDTENSAIYVQNDFFEQFELNESYPTLTTEDVETINPITQVCINIKKKWTALLT
jgi:hypothetical protein